MGIIFDPVRIILSHSHPVGFPFPRSFKCNLTPRHTSTQSVLNNAGASCSSRKL